MNLSPVKPWLVKSSSLFIFKQLFRSLLLMNYLCNKKVCSEKNEKQKNNVFKPLFHILSYFYFKKKKQESEKQKLHNPDLHLTGYFSFS